MVGSFSQACWLHAIFHTHTRSGCSAVSVGRERTGLVNNSIVAKNYLHKNSGLLTHNNTRVFSVSHTFTQTHSA